ncbi:hypothetical protein Ahy_B09g099129 [Arachis hypogaea]|uniref:Uncharacterized protein n=1 Tax=Arachis hypogaea TaxID=3818 RepID=A0A444XSX8_ARAHY|nr:hypothetical protein Ahy_B09g099129 [Arachis hypogaea]
MLLATKSETKKRTSRKRTEEQNGVVLLTWMIPCRNRLIPLSGNHFPANSPDNHRYCHRKISLHSRHTSLLPQIISISV